MKDKIYKHFKGNKYNCLGVVHEKSLDEILKLMDIDVKSKHEIDFDSTLIVLDANGDELVPREVVDFLGGYYFLNNEGVSGGILYHPVDDLSKVYFRTFDNFFEVIEKEGYGVVQRFKPLA